MIHFELNWMVCGGGGHCEPHKQYHFLDYEAEKELFKAFIKKYNLLCPLSSVRFFSGSGYFFSYNLTCAERCLAD